MQAAANRTFSQLAKHYAKKGFSGFMTFWHWNISAGWLFLEGFQGITLLSNQKKYFKTIQIPMST